MQGGFAVGGDERGEARVLEIVAHEAGDLRFVLDDQDRSQGATLPEGRRSGRHGGVHDC